MVEKGVLDGASHDDDRSSVLIAVGSFAWLIAFIVLHFIASLLLNIVDASYACVVLDLDNHARTGERHVASEGGATLPCLPLTAIPSH